MKCLIKKSQYFNYIMVALWNQQMIKALGKIYIWAEIAALQEKLKKNQHSSYLLTCLDANLLSIVLIKINIGISYI